MGLLISNRLMKGPKAIFKIFLVVNGELGRIPIIKVCFLVIGFGFLGLNLVLYASIIIFLNFSLAEYKIKKGSGGYKGCATINSRL